jgi:hypothetical protein
MKSRLTTTSETANYSRLERESLCKKQMVVTCLLLLGEVLDKNLEHQPDVLVGKPNWALTSAVP